MQDPTLYRIPALISPIDITKLCGEIKPNSRVISSVHHPNQIPITYNKLCWEPTLQKKQWYNRTILPINAKDTDITGALLFNFLSTVFFGLPTHEQLGIIFINLNIYSGQSKFKKMNKFIRELNINDEEIIRIRDWYLGKINKLMDIRKEQVLQQQKILESKTHGQKNNGINMNIDEKGQEETPTPMTEKEKIMSPINNKSNALPEFNLTALELNLIQEFRRRKIQQQMKPEDPETNNNSQNINEIINKESDDNRDTPEILIIKETNNNNNNNNILNKNNTAGLLSDTNNNKINSNNNKNSGAGLLSNDDKNE